MASIPLPALALKQPESPIETMGRVIQLKDLMGQQQLQQQQIQGATMENQQRALQIKDQQTVMQSLAAHQGDIAAALPELAGKVTPQTYMGLAKAHFETREAALKMSNEQLANDKTRNDNLLGLIDQAKQLPPEQYAQAWPQIAAKALQIKPELQGHVTPGQPIPQESLDSMAMGLQAHSTIQAQVMKEREVKAQEQTAQAHADTAASAKERLAAEMPGGALADPAKAEMSDWLKKNPGKGPADFMAYKAKLVPQFKFNLQNGAAANPANSDLVNAVANGSMKIGDVLTPRTPLQLRRQFLDQVLKANPAFNSASYDVEKGVMKEFTSGDAAKNLTAFNTAIEHAGQLQSAADAMTKGDMPALNKIGNALGYQFGSDKTTNFNVIKSALVGEISKVFKGGQATDAEIQQVQAPFNAANSSEQLKGAIQNAIALMNSKRDALKQQYQSGTQGKPNFGDTSQPGGAKEIHYKIVNGQLVPQ